MLETNLLLIILPFVVVLTVLFTWVIVGLVYRSRSHALREELVRVKAEKQAETEKVQWLSAAEEKLREAFEALASRALESNSRQMLYHNKQQLENLVKPLNLELEKLDRNVRTLEQKREGAYQSMDTQIRQISMQYRNLQETTTTLSQALRSSSVRGRWGEVQLHRIAEMAGLSEHVDFEEQKGTGEGGRPDMIVHLPNEAILPVDAKAPMSAYLDAMESDDAVVRASRLKQHASALRKHVQQLSQKAYWSQFPVSPEFVVLLVPYESGLAAAFASDPELLDYALANKVVITGPATLLFTVLVEFLLKGIKSSRIFFSSEEFFRV